MGLEPQPYSQWRIVVDPATSTIFWLLEAIKCQVRDIKVRIVPTSFALNQAKRSLAES